MARLLLASFLLFVANVGPACPAAPASDSASIERLAGLARLWGVIKYFHPTSASQDVDWDGALVAAIQKVKAAQGAQQYRAAIDSFLGVLADPVTRTVTRTAVAVPSAAAPPTIMATPESFYNLVDGALVVDCRKLMEVFFNHDGPAAFAGARKLATRNAFVFDCRHGQRSNRLGLDDEDYSRSTDLVLRRTVSELVTRPLPLGRFRYREHFGHVPQDGSSAYGYSSRLVTDAPFVLAGKSQAAEQPSIAFIIDAATPDLRELLSGLQAAGVAAVVEAGDAKTAAVERESIAAGRSVYTLSLPDGFDVRVRIAELVSPSGEVGFTPDVETIDAVRNTDQPLAAALASLRITRNRPAIPAPQAAPFPPVDRGYAEVPFPTPEYRLVSLFRFWNLIHYLYPYKYLMDRDWSVVLSEFIPKFDENTSELDYQRTILELAARLPDAHVRLENATAHHADLGGFAPPVTVESVGQETVIVQLHTAKSAEVSGLVRGDVILAVDGEPILARRARLTPWVPASTPQALQRRLDALVLEGPKDKPAKLNVLGGDGIAHELTIPRTVEVTKVAFAGRRSAPPTFGILPSGYGYIDLDRLSSEDGDKAFASITKAPALILDMRGYPRGDPLDIGTRLARVPNKLIKGPIFRRPVWNGLMLGAQDFQLGPSLTYQQSFYPSSKNPYNGKVVMLIDERAVSSAEHICLVFAAAADITFIGAPTLGTDGDTVSAILPGNLVVRFTGEEVLRPDGQQFQRIGIQPHVPIARTAAGIRAGRDEILEAAVAWLDERRGKITNPK
jgi:C-terminal processing protease CtpA/Prc